MYTLTLQDPSEDELALLEENPLYVLMEMMKALEFRLVDLFHIFDKDQNKSLSIDELQEGLEVCKPVVWPLLVRLYFVSPVQVV